MERFLLLLCFNCSVVLHPANAQNKDFSLEGTTTGFEDGIYLYFRDVVNGGNLDSAIVKDNRFRFETELPEPILFVMLFTKDQGHYTELWLEENEMTFDASAGDFQEATITGSKNQLVFKEYSTTLYHDISEVSTEVVKERESRFIKNNPDALVSALVLEGNQRWDQHEVANYFAMLSPEVRTSSMGERIARHLEKDLPEVGDAFMDFRVPSPNGKSKLISDLRGELTLLQFWASTCTPSRAMNPDLTELYKIYIDQGFEIISISMDTNNESWKQAINQDNLQWPQLSNLNGWEGEVFEAYGIHSTPSNFLINSDGVILARNLRGETLRAEIRKHLN